MVKISVRVELSADGIPVAFALRGRRFAVSELLDSWHGTDHAYFKLIASDGALYVIRHDLGENAWEMVLMEAVTHQGEGHERRG
jgi:hypothetical protein